MKCKVASKCQGCALLNMNQEEQEAKKRELVESCFKSFHLPLNINNVYMAEEPWEYRNKVIVGFAKDKNKKVISGLYAKGTHRVVDSSGCEMQPKIINKIIDKITGLIDSMKLELYNPQTRTGLIRNVMIRYAKNTDQVMVVIVTGSKMFPSRRNLVNALIHDFPQISCIYQCINTRDTSVVVEGEMSLLYGKRMLTDELCGLKISITPSCFYQINHDQCEVLYTKAIEALRPTKNERVLDTYCGVGSIGLVMADKVKEVIGVELNQEAIECAKFNARANDIDNITFVAADSTEFMKLAKKYNDHFDIIVLDPPRAGTTESFIQNAVALKPKKILYISCDPRTFVRDLRQFSDLDYFYGPVSLVDMFCQTDHIECFTVLTPRRLPGFNKKEKEDGRSARFGRPGKPALQKGGNRPKPVGRPSQDRHSNRKEAGGKSGFKKPGFRKTGK